MVNAIIRSASHLGAGTEASPQTFFQFPSAARLWGASLGFSVSSNASFSGGITEMYARIVTGSGIMLEVIELALSGAGQVVAGHGDMPFPGLGVGAWDSLILDVNNGNQPSADISLRASGFVLYSIP